MPIINREKDVSEKRYVLEQLLTTVTGTSYPICVVPFAAQFEAAFDAAIGLSGTPVGQLVVERFNASGGQTIVTGWFATFTHRALGTSGPLGYSATTLGQTFALKAGDVISVYTGGTNAAVSQLTVGVVLRALEDIRGTYPIV